MTSGIYDCRSYDPKTFANEVLRKRIERFSTVYACCFVTAAEAAVVADGVHASIDGRPMDMLLTASSTGELRLYLLADMVARWTAGQQSAEPAASWVAHRGPAACLAKAQAGTGDDLLLLSGGDDGHVRAWRLSYVLQQLQQQRQQQPLHHASASLVAPTAVTAGTAASAPAQLSLDPVLDVRLPRAEGPLGALSLPPAVQALALVGAEAGAGSGGPTLFVGCSDGGVHCLDLTTGAVAAPGGHAGSDSGHGMGLGCGHVAAVLALDRHAASGLLASGSEDGTVRLWDTRVAGSASCSHVLDTAGSGRRVGGGAEALRCLRSPPASCLRFDTSGSWLLVGHGGGEAGPTGGAAAAGAATGRQGTAAAAGGAGGAGGVAGGWGGSGRGGLSLWDLRMEQRARQAAAGFMPQAMSILPSEVLCAGSGPRLARFSLGLDPLAPTPLPATPSAFALDVHPSSGTVAVGGVGGSVELLSKYGKKTGGVSYTSEED